jgi:hypothetical protein
MDARGQENITMDTIGQLAFPWIPLNQHVTSQLEVNRKLAAGDRSLIELTRIKSEETGVSLRCKFSQ